MKKFFAVALVMALALSALAGCSSAAAPVEGETAPAADKYVIGMCNANLSEPWNVQMDADVAKAAEAYDNLEVKFKDAAGDSMTQRSQVEEFINEGVDALIISPVESTPMTAIVEEAYNAGIPVILVGRLIDSDAYTQYVGTDDFALGYAAGQWILENVGDDAKVVELQGLMTSSCGYDRALGFARAIDGSKVEVIWQHDCEWNEAVGRSEMESVLAVNSPDNIDVVFGGNDPTAHGAYLAAEAAGCADQIKFFGIDGLPTEGQGYVRDGIFAMTIYDATGGDIALDNAMKVLAGETIDKVWLKDAIIFTPETLDAGGIVVPRPADTVDRTGQQTPLLG